MPQVEEVMTNKNLTPFDDAISNIDSKMEGHYKCNDIVVGSNLLKSSKAFYGVYYKQAVVSHTATSCHAPTKLTQNWCFT